MMRTSLSKMAATMVEHVVVDAGGFLKKALLQDIGKNIYTLKDVVEEIRDKPTRRSLAFLPYQLNFREPYPEDIRLVTEFSKKTGDYPSLSATDIKVLALTYQLERENVGTDHLKKEPEVKVQVCSTRRHPEAPVGVAGFHFPSKRPADGLFSGRQRPAAQTQHSYNPPEIGEYNSFQFWRNPLPCFDTDLLELVNIEDLSISDSGAADTVHTEPETGSEEHKHSKNHSEEHSSGSEEEDEKDEDEEEDGGGWITPSNIKQVQMETGIWASPVDVKVACLTTDFAMQNVLIQIGLHVLSVNGMLIKQARNYILRCHACFKWWNANLMSALCSRSTPCPCHKGANTAATPHLVEDQRFPQQRVSRKARQKTDVLNPDYLAGGGSPFSDHDIYSRSANLHITDGAGGGGRRRANPNAARKKKC
ncbi:RNA-binding protein NOB1-like [Oncorhynchus nerka]|uniref:RNA-binding protein NOB1-like n=1 Tax=Oncorhynchus nerka TaxID=8023 RepID=UPI0031B82F43